MRVFWKCQFAFYMTKSKKNTSNANESKDKRQVDGHRNEVGACSKKLPLRNANEVSMQKSDIFLQGYFLTLKKFCLNFGFFTNLFSMNVIIIPGQMCLEQFFSSLHGQMLLQKLKGPFLDRQRTMFKSCSQSDICDSIRKDKGSHYIFWLLGIVKGQGGPKRDHFLVSIFFFWCQFEVDTLS